VIGGTILLCCLLVTFFVVMRWWRRRFVTVVNEPSRRGYTVQSNGPIQENTLLYAAEEIDT